MNFDFDYECLVEKSMFTNTNTFSFIFHNQKTIKLH